MKRALAYIAAILPLLSAPAGLSAQSYTQEPVKVSTEKVRGGDGKIYYSHVVGERQTLYSIAKAYGVSIDEIYAVNKGLKEGGLKKDAIILIPIKPGAAKPVQTAVKETSESEADVESGDYFIHKVQWYEDIDDIAKKYDVPADVILSYNNLKGKRLKARMKLKIPRDYSSSEKKKEAAEAVKREAEVLHEADAVKKEKTNLGEENMKKGTVSATLILPFGATGSVKSSSMDFYAGFLLAVKELGERGISTDLSVFDTEGGNPVTTLRLTESDIVIGPISSSALSKVIALDLSHTPIVSPLDQRAASLAESHSYVIQAPTPTGEQYRDIISWVREERRGGDRILVMSERGEKPSAAVSEFSSILAGSGLDYTSFSYSIFEGRTADTEIAARLSKSGVNRIILNSDSEAFANDLMRNLNVLAHKGYEIVIYCPAKIRGFNTIDIEDFHNLQVHVSSSYYTDYDSPQVMNFLLEYRALYNAEPSQFAFQGYDVGKFFLSAVAEGGRNWMHSLAGKSETKMLQSDFRFESEESGGLVNRGIRRFIYGSDYSVGLVK